MPSIKYEEDWKTRSIFFEDQCRPGNVCSWGSGRGRRQPRAPLRRLASATPTSGQSSGSPMLGMETSVDSSFALDTQLENLQNIITVKLHFGNLDQPECLVCFALIRDTDLVFLSLLTEIEVGQSLLNHSVPSYPCRNLLDFTMSDSLPNCQ